MAFEINTQQTAGITLVARIYNGSTKLGSDVALTENTVEAGLYFSGAVSTSGFADGEHQVIVYDTIAGEILGSGVQIFKDEKTIEDYNLEVLEVDSGQARFTQKALEQAPVADVSSLATSAEVGDIPTNPLLTTDARLNNLDATVSSRSTFDASTDQVVSSNMRGTDGANTTTPPSVAEIDAQLSNSHGNGSWEDQGATGTVNANITQVGGVSVNNPNDLKADVSSLATSAQVGNIPTNPLLTTDARLNNLDATVSSRSTFDASADEVTTDAASREASKADVSGLASSGDSATILTNQAVINEGIKKASKLIPHNDNL